MTAFDVDTTDLASTLADLADCQRALIDLATDVRAEVERLDEDWSGAARDAHATSYAAWREGFADMVEALATLRSIGTTAGDNYTGCVEANLSLWAQLR